jgi:hypothetical protein
LHDSSLIRHRHVLFSGLGFLLLAACSTAAPDDSLEKDKPAASDGPKASDCSAFAPCGGNLLGRWRARSACVGTVTNDPACSGYVSNRATSGTAIYDFGADGILRYEGSIDVAYDISVNDACAQAIARKDAASYCKLVEGSSDDNPRVPATITCSASEALCSCHVDQGPISGGPDSSYAVSGNSVTILADGSADEYGYCVSGEALTLGSLAGQPSLVFARQ